MECLEPRWITIGISWSNPVEREQLVPCGKCAYCLVNKRQSWVFRIMQELKSQDYRGWFLTLTYAPKYVPRRDNGMLSLRFRDVQLFLKRIRKKKYYVKYVCVGEYGSETQRPHYHLLLWTDAPSDFLSKQWYLGLIHFGTLNVQSAMYAMKYIIQPKVNYAGREKPRAQFSKGMGLSFLSTAMYYYLTQDEDNPIYFVYVDGQKQAIPKYYKDKIFTRHQKRVVGYNFRMEKEKEKKEEISRLRSLGIADPESYLHRLREDKAELIFKKSKVNELL